MLLRVSLDPCNSRPLFPGSFASQPIFRNSRRAVEVLTAEATVPDREARVESSQTPLSSRDPGNDLPSPRAEIILPACLGILEVSCLAAALCFQVSLLRAARVNQQVIGRADTSLILLTIAAVIRVLHQLWSNARRISGNSRDPTSLLGQVSASGAVRLHRLEILHTRQATVLSNMERELSKARLWVHSLSKDLQPALRQTQAESAVHAEGLVSVSKKLESLSSEFQDTRELLSELQGASLKQLQLVIQAINLARKSSESKIQSPHLNQ